MIACHAAYSAKRTSKLNAKLADILQEATRRGLTGQELRDVKASFKQASNEIAKIEAIFRKIGGPSAL